MGSIHLENDNHPSDNDDAGEGGNGDGGDGDGNACEKGGKRW